MSSRPPDAEYQAATLYYKVGIHDVVFVWLNERWVRSTKTKRELEAKTSFVKKGENNERRVDIDRVSGKQ